MLRWGVMSTGGIASAALLTPCEWWRAAKSSPLRSPLKGTGRRVRRWFRHRHQVWQLRNAGRGTAGSISSPWPPHSLVTRQTLSPFSTQASMPVREALRAQRHPGTADGGGSAKWRSVPYGGNLEPLSAGLPRAGRRGECGPDGEPLLVEAGLGFRRAFDPEDRLFRLRSRRRRKPGSGCVSHSAVFAPP